MPFWRRTKKLKLTGITIQCPACEWQPDGKKNWGCSNCGHVWDTFTTRGVCPKCKTKFETTWCPGCGQSTPHTDWYKTAEQLAAIERDGDPVYRAKKKQIESRLIAMGITNRRVSSPTAFNYNPSEFVSAYDVGCRMMILFGLALSAHDLVMRDAMAGWFKDENIWDKVSPQEIEFLTELTPSEALCGEISWGYEGAVVLAWCLGIVTNLPALNAKDPEYAFEEFEHKAPEPGDDLQQFLSSLAFIDMDEIYEEAMLNDMVLSYLRDQYLRGQGPPRHLNTGVNMQRTKALNWLQGYFPKTEGAELTGEAWDETDTST